MGHLAATLIAQAPAVAADWERLEGMLLKISVPLTVSGNHGLTRYGEIVASFDGRLFQPVQTQAPGAAAMALAANNARRTLLLDDNRSSQDPRNLWILAKELSDAQPVRAGSVLRGVTGVLDQRRGIYRLQLVSPPEVQHAPRPPAPSVEGNVRIASLNLLNLFNGDGHGGGFPTQRGAETFELHQMQLRKLVATVQALAPDVAALMEVENDGSGPDSALAQFVQALNAAGPIRDYRLIDTGTASGSDDIRVAMVYRSSRVGLQGTVATLAGGPFEQRSRVPLAQAFRAGNGPVFVVAANHFKSKGCGRDEDIAQGAEADQQDGQSCWNPTRSDSAQRVSDWLKSDPTGTGAALQLILGDLNAYAMEDPLRLLRQAGWHDALSLKGPRETGEPGYSYVYEGQAGRLDHALVNAALLLRLRGAHEWHGNADEAPFFGYQNDREADPYRASDHDPLLLGFELER